MPRIAAIQMCSGTDVDENLKQVKKFFAQAAQQNAQLVILPENFALMANSETDKLTIAETFNDGPIQQTLSTLARKYSVWIIAGTIPLIGDQPNKLRASCIVYNEQGAVVTRYDKIHLFDVTLNHQETYNESATLEAGNSMIAFNSPVGRIGLAICYDIRFPELFYHLSQQNIDCIVIPCAFTQTTGKAHWHTLTRCRALDNQCFLIAACQGGQHDNGRQTYGHSLFINPWGDIMTTLDTKPGVLIAELDIEAMQKLRQKFPLYQHRRNKFIINNLKTY